jgi:hypothetical protein
MTIAIQCDLICDICQTRLASSTENLPNKGGKTKGSPTLEVREKAKKVGWRRIKLPNVGIAKGIRRPAMTLDCCPDCAKSQASSRNHLQTHQLWFEKEI